jgi:hypothetical protein
MGKNTKKKSAGAATTAVSVDLVPYQKELANLLVSDAAGENTIKRLLAMTNEPELAQFACDALARISQRMELIREIIRLNEGVPRIVALLRSPGAPKTVRFAVSCVVGMTVDAALRAHCAGDFVLPVINVLTNNEGTEEVLHPLSALRNLTMGKWRGKAGPTDARVCLRAYL